jgi:hypothetical protein
MSHLQITTKGVGKLDLARCPALHLEQCWAGNKNSYAAFFFPALTLAHLAR